MKHNTPDPLIAIDHVTFGYDVGRTILDDVTLAFERGKVTSLLGGSGCGKTTLLRLIGGVHAANAGEVRFDGKPVDAHDREGLYKLRRRLGMLFQFGALFTDLTVFDNVAFPQREQVECHERGRRLDAELVDPGFGRMDPLAEQVEIEAVVRGDHDLAVDHALRGQLRPKGRRQFGEVASERLLVPAPEYDLVAVTEHDAPEPVPLRFEDRGCLSRRIIRHRLDRPHRLAQHRRQRRHDGKTHASVCPTRYSIAI